MRQAKQVIVMRRKFVIDGETKTVRTGKMIAQGAHASMAALLNIMERSENFDKPFDQNKPPEARRKALKLTLFEDTPLYEWLKGRFTKVVVYVDTLEELEQIFEKAEAANQIRAMITDAGLTEFKGQPQKTCCAIGPGWAEDIDLITGKLPLL